MDAVARPGGEGRGQDAHTGPVERVGSSDPVRARRVAGRLARTSRQTPRFGFLLPVHRHTAPGEMSCFKTFQL